MGGMPLSFIDRRPTSQLKLAQVASGIMFNSWEAHYRRIGVVKFTQDGAALVTGSDDSTVAVWPMSRYGDDFHPGLSL